jgi:hypothetical protein
MSNANGWSCFGLNPNKIVIRYLNWAFRSSFVAVFFSAALAFFGLCLLFAILIYASGMNKPHCVYVNGVEFGTTGANFMDAFALSWTTFSTVVCPTRNCLVAGTEILSNACLTSHIVTIFYASGLRINSPGNINDQWRSQTMHGNYSSDHYGVFCRYSFCQCLWCDCFCEGDENRILRPSGIQ